jgi:uncharacterized SAM-binding protein YcdF (DUF218 family)
VKLLRIGLLALAVGGAVFGFRHLGSYLQNETPLQKADVIFALGGMRLERVVEAGTLHLEGWAPRILLSQPLIDSGERTLAARGIHVDSEAEFQRSALVRMGVSADAVLIIDEGQDSTASEAGAIRRLARIHQWTRVIFVTSRLHTRRAGLALRRQLEPAGITVIARAARTDDADIERWWRRRRDFRFVLFETQKLVAYWIGVAD